MLCYVMLLFCYYTRNRIDNGTIGYNFPSSRKIHEFCDKRTSAVSLTVINHTQVLTAAGFSIIKQLAFRRVLKAAKSAFAGAAVAVFIPPPPVPITVVTATPTFVPPPAAVVAPPAKPEIESWTPALALACVRAEEEKTMSVVTPEKSRKDKIKELKAKLNVSSKRVSCCVEVLLHCSSQTSFLICGLSCHFAHCSSQTSFLIRGLSCHTALSHCSHTERHH
jgi:hypothetical protein